jgi:long-chain acyl-CoA synthetase
MTWKHPNHRLSSKLLKPLHDGFGGRLRYIFAGGAYVERDMAQFFHRIGIPVAIGYGLTEAGTVLTLNDLKPFRADTVGRPLDGVDLELRDLDSDGVGEVWVRGRTVMKGYLDEPELTAESIVDGWLRTGDRGRLDAAGHLKLLGRAKNMIVTAGGKNVYPEDVEALLGDVPGCDELCVVATDYVWPGCGGLGAETLAAVVHLDEGGNLESVMEELARRNRSLADYKRLTYVVVAVAEFPRTASMKVKRGVLAEQVRAQGGPDALLVALEVQEAAE